MAIEDKTGRLAPRELKMPYPYLSHPTQTQAPGLPPPTLTHLCRIVWTLPDARRPSPTQLVTNLAILTAGVDEIAAPLHHLDTAKASTRLGTPHPMPSHPPALPSLPPCCTLHPLEKRHLQKSTKTTRSKWSVSVMSSYFLPASPTPFASGSRITPSPLLPASPPSLAPLRSSARRQRLPPRAHRHSRQPRLVPKRARSCRVSVVP
ncbi:hypothetical protein B0H14DRAFT_3781959 [Mycena olivaceomarginata]|nr:hypothetical protein B0H14DRAFT_3781959 [Mycena olivaceomarginata]